MLVSAIISRVHNADTWAKRLLRFAPITCANVETVRFDMQLMENPILLGWNISKGRFWVGSFANTCCIGIVIPAPIAMAYRAMRCWRKSTLFQKALGGTNRLASHVISCHSCNEDKGSLQPNAWAQLCTQRGGQLNATRAKNMQRILASYRPSLKDAAAVNATRYAVGALIKCLIACTKFWSDGRTKKNSSGQGYPKDHWIDAACVGEKGGAVLLLCDTVLVANVKGHGSRQMCLVDKYGFPHTTAKTCSMIIAEKR